MANTDAPFRIERPDPDSMTITVTAGRMKDCEPPPPFSLAARVVNTGDVDPNGKQITTLVLEPTETVAAKPKRPTGNAQRSILTELERRQRSDEETPVWTIDEVRSIAKELEIGRTSARDATRSLIESGFLKPTVGGLALGYQPWRRKRRKAAKRTFSPGWERRKWREIFRSRLFAIPSPLS